jgi:membrane-associated phospholipid phosphatase
MATSTPDQKRGPRITAHAGHLYASLRAHPHSRRIKVLLALLVADLVLFANIAEDYATGDPIVRWDLRLARWLYESSNPTLVDAAKIVTWLGSGLFLLGLVLWLSVGLLRRNRVNDALLLVIAYAGAQILNAVLKLIFHRPRPDPSFVHLTTFSFPSGHATASAAVYTLIAWLAIRRLRSTLWQVAVGVAAALLIALIGFTRMYLGAHYLSDVLAGTCAGLAWALGAILVATIDRDVLGWFPGPVRRLVLRLVPG